VERDDTAVYRTSSREDNHVDVTATLHTRITNDQGNTCCYSSYI